MAAKQKEGVDSLSPEQQLTKPPDPPAASHPAPLKSQEEPIVLKSELVKHESEPVRHEPETVVEALPSVIVKELDKQEVELLVSLFLVPTQDRYSCTDNK